MRMKVPFLDVTREWNFFEKKFLLAFKKFGQSGIYVLGPEVEKFERDFAKYCGYQYAVGVSTGLSALEMILRAYNVGPGDEVITVANSAVATSLAISNVQATPVFCDVGDDFLMDVDKIESLITVHTKAILPVHLFGKICDLAAINKIAKKYKLIVVEDACQAHGADFRGESLKNTKAFSFYPTKNLGALGEGGAVVTNDEKIKNFVWSYRNYGQRGRYNHVIKGGNYRLDPLKCVLLGIKLKKLKYFISQRQDIAKKYINAFKNIDSLVINRFDPSCAYHLFVIRVLNGKRDKLRDYLKDQGLETLIHYPIAIHRQRCYRKEHEGSILKNTDKFQEEILSLPCFAFLNEREQNFVIANIKKFFIS